MAGLRDAGVVVIGAGTAGLSAARHLRAHGVATTLIEALPRIGGRAVTIDIAGQPFDLGATWLHDAEHNPLTRLADPATLINSDADRREHVTVAGRSATVAERAAYEAAWDRLDTVAAPALRGSDTTLAAAMRPMADDPWAPLVALWEGAIIAAADAGRLGLQDWHRNRLGGRNAIPAAGVGAFIADVLATEAFLSTPASRVAWHGPGVVVETARGAIRAGAAIVTVSTGVLAAGHIRFDPPLPYAAEAAIHALPMGLLSKIALPAPGLGLEPGTVLVDRDASMTFIAHPRGHGYVSGFVGGDHAWRLAADPAALEAFALDELARSLGRGALRTVGPAAAITCWGTDPKFLGAYAYAGPGGAGQRGVLGDVCLGGRVLFAGEAVRTDGLAGTVGGAFLSGVEAADRLLAGG